MKANRCIWLLISIFAIGALYIGACSVSISPPSYGDESARVTEADSHMSENHPMHDNEHMEGEHHEAEHMGDEHHAHHMHHDLPAEYADLVNPFAGDPEALVAGAALYAVNCASCHGDTGMGDGPAATALDPRPAPLADVSMMSDLSDAYIFWRITEGGLGEPFNSAMPPWGEVFGEKQRWQLVTFVRSLTQ